MFINQKMEQQTACLYPNLEIFDHNLIPVATDTTITEIPIHCMIIWAVLDSNQAE